MNILITGNLGYIGSVLSDYLIKKEYKIVGFDNNLYKKNILCNDNKLNKQINKDIRNVSDEDFKKIDILIFLAALSNDPLGELNPNITNEINFEASISFIKKAKKNGVKKVIFISTQSIYGVSKTNEELDEELSEKNPVTEYAKAKYKAEIELRKIASDNFVICILRPSTVFGVSPRFRSDIVFNNFISCAYLNKKIEILSDGSPWRPVVHILDLCSAINAVLIAPDSLVNNEAFNVGIENGNYSVKDLALAAQNAIPNSELVFLNEHTDPRTYKVSFKKILNVLSDFYKPEWNLEKGAIEMVNFFKKIDYSDEMFRGRMTTRLMQIKYLIDKKELDDNMRWL
mgnify:CR=1 FL=1|tara:strand:- start:110 stop:1138 length:1029 start_codon:yes stop_codon:yes gene_type:complete